MGLIKVEQSAPSGPINRIMFNSGLFYIGLLVSILKRVRLNKVMVTVFFQVKLNRQATSH